MHYKTIGLIGGIGPEATVDYYKQLISTFQKKTNENSYPHIIINSIDLTRLVDLISNHQFEALVEFLGDEIENLHKAGAQVCGIASNTPHIVFDRIRQQSEFMPLISIVEETRKEAARLGLKKIGLLGTRFTMTGEFYQKEFGEYSMQIFIPSQEYIDLFHDKYMNELVKGILKPDTKKDFINIVNDMRSESKIDGLILGGTELPLLLNENDFSDFRVLNTTAIHINSLVDYAIQE